VLQDASFVLLLNQLQQQAALLNPFQLSTSLYSLGLLQVRTAAAAAAVAAGITTVLLAAACTADASSTQLLRSRVKGAATVSSCLS
jgi:hypothetical protein